MYKNHFLCVHLFTALLQVNTILLYCVFCFIVEGEYVGEQTSSSTSSDCNDLDEAFVGDESTDQPSPYFPEGEMPKEEDLAATNDQKRPSISHIISSVVSAWEILVGLLSALKQVARLHLLQGNVNQAHYYAKEGALLARTMLLQGW